MTRGRRREKLDVLPVREELEALIRWYHHLQNEHTGAQLESGVRRRLEDDVLEVRARIDRLLDEWVSDEGLREAWLRHVDYREPEPDEPGAIRPLLFRGVNDAGSTAEVRRGKDGLDVEVDGTLVERVEAERDLAATRLPARLRVDDFVFEETFEVPAPALEELATFLEEGGAPPWAHASELLADGLIDVHFDLTPRGRRALAAA